MKQVLLSCLLLFVVGPVVAQRRWSAVSYDDPASGRAFLAHDSRTFAEWTWTIAGVKSSGTLAMPLGKAGAVTLVNANTLLLSGWSGSAGWLAEVTFTVAGQTVVPTLAAMPVARDVVRLAYLSAAAVMVGIDHNRRELLVARYAPGLQLGPWEVIATAAQCPLLGINSLALALEPMPGGTGAVLLAREPYEGMESWRVTQDAHGTWRVVPQSAGMLPVVHPPAWCVSAHTVMAANSLEFELWIGGGAGSFCIVEHESNALVWAGHHSGNPVGQVFSIPCAALDHGRLYRVQSGTGDGVEASVPFFTAHVWQRAAVGPDMVASQLSVAPELPVVGTFFLGWELYWRSAAAPPTHPMLLAVSFGAWSAGTDPKLPFFGVDLLAAPWGPWGLQLAAWQGRGALTVQWLFACLPPSLLGLSFAVQVVGSLPDGQLLVSDVVGLPRFGSRSAGGAGASGRR